MPVQRCAMLSQVAIDLWTGGPMTTEKLFLYDYV